jgi:alkanesulfonate monooxygenase SsuD/methylene tetrahydromethanopterin reductase-like flavin-dependent oxidoreductase (luciferase family)
METVREMSMKLGLSVKFDLDKDSDPVEGLERLKEEVRFARDAGFRIVQVGDRHATTFPVLSGIPLASHLTAIAGDMTVSCLFILPFYDPVLLAEYISNLDVLSHGKFLPIFAIGRWDRDFSSLRIPLSHRKTRFEESLQIMRMLWSQDDVSFKGKRFVIENVTINPKPIQKPLPLWIAGDSEAAMNRAAKLANAWLLRPRLLDEQVVERMSAFREALKKYGRLDKVKAFPIRRNVHLAKTCDRAVQEAAPYVKRGALRGEEKLEGTGIVIGSAKECVDNFKHLETLGIDTVMIRQIVDDRAMVMDMLQIFRDEVIPTFSV